MVSPQLHFERGNRGCPMRVASPHIKPPKPFKAFKPSVLPKPKTRQHSDIAASYDPFSVGALSSAVKYTTTISFTPPSITLTSIVFALVASVKRSFSGINSE